MGSKWRNMAQVSGEKYPELTPEEAERITDVLINEYGGSVSSEEAFAQSIGHSTSNSGAYRGKLADLRKYGLLESRGLEPTRLAYNLANPEDAADEYQTKFEMMDNVPLLRDLYENLGGRDPPAELWRVIEEITGANPKAAREASEDLEELYEAMLEFDEKRKREPSKPAQVPTEPEEPTAEREPKTQQGGIFVRVGSDEMNFGDVKEGNLNLAITFLQNKRDELEQGESQDPK